MIVHRYLLSAVHSFLYAQLSDACTLPLTTHCVCKSTTLLTLYHLVLMINDLDCNVAGTVKFSSLAVPHLPSSNKPSLHRRTLYPKAVWCVNPHHTSSPQLILFLLSNNWRMFTSAPTPFLRSSENVDSSVPRRSRKHTSLFDRKSGLSPRRSRICRNRPESKLCRVVGG